MKRLLFATALLVLCGCDLFADYTTIAEGKVVNKDTGEPIEGIFVAVVDFVGYGIYVYKDSTRTDAQGRYYLKTAEKRKQYLVLILWSNRGDGVFDRGKSDNRYSSTAVDLVSYRTNVKTFNLQAVDGAVNAGTGQLLKSR